MPHNHRMWAVIGIYTGREDNIFWRRVAGASDGKIEAAGARALSDRDAVPLGQDIILSVLNPINRLTGAIHVYGGDFFALARSEWDSERLVEQPFDVEKTLALFEEFQSASPIAVSVASSPSAKPGRRWTPSAPSVLARRLDGMHSELAWPRRRKSTTLLPPLIPRRKTALRPRSPRPSSMRRFDRGTPLA